jgi:ribonucleoside-diphosphate reductase alpha chain
MLSMLFETGHPWMTFKDACNVRSPQQHSRHGPQLEPLHRDHAQHERDRDRRLQPGLDQPARAHEARAGGGDRAWELDQAKLQSTVRTAMRMLDNVIDINYYAVVKARNSNLKHRPSASASWASRIACTCRTRRTRRKTR